MCNFRLGKSFEYVLNDMSLKASEVVMVGDSIKNDYEGAEKVGMKAVLIDRWNKHVDFYGKKISNMTELMSVISNINQPFFVERT